LTKTVILISIVLVILSLALGVTVGLELGPQVTKTSVQIQISNDTETLVTTVPVIVFQTPNSTVSITKQVIVESILWAGGCTEVQNTTITTLYDLPQNYSSDNFYATVITTDTSYFGTTIITTSMTPVITTSNGTTYFIGCA